MVRKTNTPNMDPNLNILIFSSYKKKTNILSLFYKFKLFYTRNLEKLSQFIASGWNDIIRNIKRILIEYLNQLDLTSSQTC